MPLQDAFGVPERALRGQARNWEKVISAYLKMLVVDIYRRHLMPEDPSPSYQKFHHVWEQIYWLRAVQS